jgi:hypothetical protein
MFVPSACPLRPGWVPCEDEGDLNNGTAMRLGIIVRTVLFAALLWATLFAQRAGYSAGASLFHIQGTIYGPPNFAQLKFMEGIEVQFQSGRSITTVFANDKGFYTADLPLGLYKMTARGPKMGHKQDIFSDYVRLFRVASPTTIVIDGTLYMERTSCDILVGGTPEQQATKLKDSCGGADSFQIPGRDGTLFELVVRYPRRRITSDGSYIYSVDATAQPQVPVFVAYNLFSLEASEVTYAPKKRTIEVNGAFMAVHDSGSPPQVAHSKTFKVENGQALQVQ